MLPTKLPIHMTYTLPFLKFQLLFITDYRALVQYKVILVECFCSTFLSTSNFIVVGANAFVYPKEAIQLTFANASLL